MAVSLEEQQPKETIFQQYELLVGSNPVIALRKSDSPEEVLKDRQKRLQAMAFVFNAESFRQFHENTILAFEGYFLEHIHKIAAGSALSDEEVKPYIGKRDEVKDELRKAKTAFAQSRNSLTSSGSAENTRRRFYTKLNECTLHFENALASWGRREPYSTLLPSLKKLTVSSCRRRLVEIYDYVLAHSYSDIEQDSLGYHERELRQEIILTVLDRDIFQKEGIIPDLREAKILLNLTLDELDSKQKTEASDDRGINFLEECEGCLDKALKNWNE